jgi:2-pyrone-4,6-dicarboxylate lactonase
MNFTQTNRVIPAGACDCHAHIYGPFDQFPFGRSAPFQPPLAPAKALEGLWEAFGVERAVLIQAARTGRITGHC